VDVSADIRAAAAALMPDGLVISVEPLRGGSSAFVAALVLESPIGDRRTVVFRQHRDRTAKDHTGGVAAREFHLTGELAAMGFEVPRPLVLHEGEPIDGPWFVAEWVEGSTTVDPADVDSALSQMARFLARLHSLDPASLNGTGLGRIEDPEQALPAYLPDDDNGQILRQTLDRGVQRRPNIDVLLHGDFWPGNVMFARTDLVAVLDWEDATWGDPLADLACARVEMACAYGWDASERFTTSYVDSVREQGVRLIDDDLALWDAYVSATALSAMHLWGLDPADETERRGTTTTFLQAATARLVDSSGAPTGNPA